jgi:hypothetical protein
VAAAAAQRQQRQDLQWERQQRIIQEQLRQQEAFEWQQHGGGDAGAWR